MEVEEGVGLGVTEAETVDVEDTDTVLVGELVGVAVRVEVEDVDTVDVTEGVELKEAVNVGEDELLERFV